MPEQSWLLRWSPHIGWRCFSPSKVDNTISDDPTVVWEKHQKFLFMFGHLHRLLQILLELGSEFLVHFCEQRKLNLMSIVNLAWKEDVSIKSFVDRFTQLIKRPNDSGFLQKPVDQHTIFYTKLSANWKANLWFYKAVLEIKQMDVSIDITVPVVTQVVLWQYPEGNVTFDNVESVQHSSNSGHDFGPQLHNNTVCYVCDGRFPHITNECSVKAHACIKCGKTRHLKPFCLKWPVDQKIQSGTSQANVSRFYFSDLATSNQFSMATTSAVLR